MRTKGRACKAGRDKDVCKATETIDKGCAGNGPIMSADVGMLCVYADVHQNTEDCEGDDGEIGRAHV